MLVKEIPGRHRVALVQHNSWHRNLGCWPHLGQKLHKSYTINGKISIASTITQHGQAYEKNMRNNMAIGWSFSLCLTTLCLDKRSLKVNDGFAALLTTSLCKIAIFHDDVIKWKQFPRYWPFVRGIHRSPVNSPHKGQWRGALMFYLVCARINGWVNNREAGDLRRHPAHCDVIVMLRKFGGASKSCSTSQISCQDQGNVHSVYTGIAIVQYYMIKCWRQKIIHIHIGNVELAQAT